MAAMISANVGAVPVAGATTSAAVTVPDTDQPSPLTTGPTGDRKSTIAALTPLGARWMWAWVMRSRPRDESRKWILVSLSVVRNVPVPLALLTTAGVWT